MNLTRLCPGYACGDRSYVEQVTQALELLGCTRSDAQAIVEGNEGRVAYGYLLGATPALVAADCFAPVPGVKP
jgi:hypothetical protein